MQAQAFHSNSQFVLLISALWDKVPPPFSGNDQRRYIIQVEGFNIVQTISGV